MIKWLPSRLRAESLLPVVCFFNLPHQERTPMDANDNTPSSSQLILYQTEDGTTRIQCRFEEENVWLTQRLLSDLYQVGVNTINHHIKEIFGNAELRPEATIRQYRIVQNEGGRTVERDVDHYSLEMILAIGYRVRSQRGIQFRQWATVRLKEYLVKGFV